MCQIPRIGVLLHYFLKSPMKLAKTPFSFFKSAKVNFLKLFYSSKFKISKT